MKTYSVIIGGQYYIATATPYVGLNGTKVCPSQGKAEELIRQVVAEWKQELGRNSKDRETLMDVDVSSQVKEAALCALSEQRKLLNDKYFKGWRIFPIEGAGNYTSPPLEGWDIDF